MISFFNCRLVFYPLDSAMHGAINFHTKRWGWFCLKPPTRSWGKWWPAYFYLSPDGTPSSSTLLIGSRFCREDKLLAKLRRILWGHGYDPSHKDTDPHRACCYIRSFVGYLPATDDPLAPQAPYYQQALRDCARDMR